MDGRNGNTNITTSSVPSNNMYNDSSKLILMFKIHFFNYTGVLRNRNRNMTKEEDEDGSNICGI